MSKLFNDNIHKTIELSELAVSIIDTPIFQRLRNIKQLGAASYVFPNATHTRFEHSIGVAYLAKELLTILKINQPELNVTDDDLNNVEIAGLCHDLGHGPFSHAFDNVFLINSDSKFKHHEERSCELLKYIIKEYSINISNKNLEIIIDMINPKNIHNRSFISNIVADPITCLDVDKLDYISRDTYLLGLKSSIDYFRLFKKCKVIDNQLCFDKREAFNIYEIFRLRYKLHKTIYNHPVIKCYEYMIIDLLKEIDDEYLISETIDDPNNFYKLTDSIIDIIEFFPNTDNYKKAKHLLKRMKERNIYNYIDEILIPDNKKHIYYDFIKDYNNKIKESNNNIIIQEMVIGLSGGSDYNPIEKMRFYDNKNDNIKLKVDEISSFITKNNKELYIRFYTKESSLIPSIINDIELLKLRLI